MRSILHLKVVYSDSRRTKKQTNERMRGQCARQVMMQEISRQFTVGSSLYADMHASRKSLSINCLMSHCHRD